MLKRKNRIIKQLCFQGGCGGYGTILGRLTHILPTQIGNYFDTSATQTVRHTYSLRSQINNRPPRFISKSKIGEKSIQYKGSQIWNAMPIEVKNYELFAKFKTSYKNYLLQTEIDPTIFLNQTDLLLSSWLALYIQPSCSLICLTIPFYCIRNYANTNFFFCLI